MVNENLIDGTASCTKYHENGNKRVISFFDNKKRLIGVTTWFYMTGEL